MEPTPEVIAISHRMWCERQNCKYLDKIDYRNPYVGCPEGHFGPWDNRDPREAGEWKKIERSIPAIKVQNNVHPVYPFVQFGHFSQPGRVGSELKKLLAKFGLKPAKECKCTQHINEMNWNGIEWCNENIDTIVGWLREEADRAHLPFSKLGARIMVKRAISNARKKLPK